MTATAKKTKPAPVAYVWVPLTEVAVGDTVRDGNHDQTVTRIEEGDRYATIHTDRGNEIPVSNDPTIGRIRKPAPVTPGMGATVTINGDSYPATVRSVSPSGHKIEVSRDASRGGRIFYIPRDDSRREVFTRRQGGRYVERGTDFVHLELGFRRHSLDPHF